MTTQTAETDTNTTESYYTNTTRGALDWPMGWRIKVSSVVTCGDCGKEYDLKSGGCGCDER